MDPLGISIELTEGVMTWVFITVTRASGVTTSHAGRHSTITPPAVCTICIYMYDRKRSILIIPLL